MLTGCGWTRLLRRKAVKIRKETGDERWKAPIEMMHRSLHQEVLRSLYRPMLLLIFEPMCLNLCIFSALLLGIIYLFFGAFQLVFSNIYGFSLSQIGMSFLGLLVGMLIATCSDPLWRRNYRRLVLRREREVGKPGEYEPEWRLPPGKQYSWLVPLNSKYPLNTDLTCKRLRELPS